MKAPCATIGAELPGGLRIAAATMRGVESQGMLCSAAELGIDEDAAGLLALPDDAPVGASVRDVLQLDDALIELKITPNRADCLSVEGIARDVAAVTGAPFVPPAIDRRPGDEPRRRARYASKTRSPALASCRASSRGSTPARRRPPG